jgi:hypothetical protein
MNDAKNDKAKGEGEFTTLLAPKGSFVGINSNNCDQFLVCCILTTTCMYRKSENLTSEYILQLHKLTRPVKSMAKNAARLSL